MQARSNTAKTRVQAARWDEVSWNSPRQGEGEDRRRTEADDERVLPQHLAVALGRRSLCENADLPPSDRSEHGEDEEVDDQGENRDTARARGRVS